MQRPVLISPFLLLATVFSIVALAFSLMALVGLYFENPNVLDSMDAWAPFAIVCSFLVLGALGAARAMGGLRRGSWHQALALLIGGVALPIALVAGVAGVVMAASADRETFYHGLGWLALAEPAAIVGAAWLIVAPPERE